MSALKPYLADQNLSQKAFALRLSVDPSIVSRLANGQMLPSLELAVQIERETGGAVPATSWIPDVQPAALSAGGPKPEEQAA